MYIIIEIQKVVIIWLKKTAAYAIAKDATNDRFSIY